jgi:hypothetical protein
MPFFMKKLTYLAGSALTIFPTLVFAHEGHGHVEATNPLHYLAEPLHAIILLAGVALIGGIVYYFAKQGKKG